MEKAPQLSSIFQPYLLKTNTGQHIPSCHWKSGSNAPSPGLTCQHCYRANGDARCHPLCMTPKDEGEREREVGWGGGRGQVTLQRIRGTIDSEKCHYLTFDLKTTEPSPALAGFVLNFIKHSLVNNSLALLVRRILLTRQHLKLFKTYPLSHLSCCKISVDSRMSGISLTAKAPHPRVFIGL